MGSMGFETVAMAVPALTRGVKDVVPALGRGVDGGVLAVMNGGTR